MHVESVKGAILGHHDGRGKSGDEGGQGGRSVEVANATMCKGCQKVPRVGITNGHLLGL